MNCNHVTSFDSFGVEHIPKEIKKFINNKCIKTNIYSIQANDSIMCACFCIVFIDLILKGKGSVDYNNSLPCNKYERNDTIILKHFQ